MRYYDLHLFLTSGYFIDQLKFGDIFIMNDVSVKGGSESKYGLVKEMDA